MTLRSSRRTLGLLFLMLAASSASPAQGQILWYNGDYDNRDSLVNQSLVPINHGGTYTVQTALVYDNFVVPVGQTWFVSSVFSNNQVAYPYPVTSATWQIRSGVSAGNGGTLVASGDTAATQTAVTPVGGYYYGDTEYKISTSIPTITLGAGTYWLAVAPDDLHNGSIYYGAQSYIETTSGANAVGIPKGNDGMSYVTSNYPTSGYGAYNFTPSTTALAGDGDGPIIDFSMGVTGTALIFTPEPSTLMMAATGLVGSLVVLARRRAKIAL